MYGYSYFDELPNELKFIADTYGDLGNAPLFLKHFGIFAFCICLTTLLAFVFRSLLIHFMVSKLTVSCSAFVN